MGLKYELQRIISGVGKNSEGSVIKAAAYHLGKSKETSGKSQENEFTKRQETKELISWIEESKVWFSFVEHRLRFACTIQGIFL